MKDFKGTPGPWVAADTVIESEGSCIAEINGDDTSWEQDEYNATLMAAAPELLEALQELFADYKQLADSVDAGFWDLEDTEVGKKSLAAIAKALGK